MPMIAGGEPSPPSGRHPSAVRLLIVTDHALLADGIQALAQGRDWLVTRAVSDIRALAAAMQSWTPTVVLVDSPASVQRVLDAALLYGGGGEVGVVVLAADEPEQIRDALLAGARGFVQHRAGTDALFACIEAVSRGEWGLPRRFVGQLVAEWLSSHGGQRRPVTPLEPREERILELLAGGAGAAAIGERLFLSEGAIRTELRILKRKFGVTSRARLVALALQNGVVPSYGLTAAGPAAAAGESDPGRA
ncbi:MAG TPA: response regulator transcription factor [Dehalococcoidia bacterium]|nr:response regulator transcription factor [Dehalococcoidia bacterium]